MIRPPCSGWISISQTPPRNFTAPRIVVSRRVRHLLSATVAVCLLTACSPGTATHLPSPSATNTPTSAALPSPSASPTPASKPHVFVIVMENRSYDQAMTGAYTAQLAARYSVATNYHGVSHPSLPNYLALTSGSTWGIADDGWHPLPAGGLGAQLSAAGISWRAYMEGMSSNCTGSAYPYALKHNPFTYYGTSCGPEIVPFSQFDSDLAGTIPNFVWITPDLCHDGHDCSTQLADEWLSQTVPKILATSAWRDDGVLLITWDEGEDSVNHVLTIVVHPGTIVHTSDHAYDHY